LVGFGSVRSLPQVVILVQPGYQFISRKSLYPEKQPVHHRRPVHLVRQLLLSLHHAAQRNPGLQCYETFFPSSLMMRPNKLEHLSLETLSGQVLEFEGKARANPIGAPFRCFLLE
jgi:hypothetical protein